MQTGERARTGTRRLSAIGMLVLVAGCSAAGQGGAASVSAPAASAPPAATATVAPSSGPAATSSTAASATTSHLIAQVHGDGQYPTVSVDAPAGWSSNGGFFLKSGSVNGISVWDVTQIPSDPCRWKGSLEDPGKTVADLVRKLTSQETRQASAPVDVALAGFDGRYVEWSVPSDMVVTGDADFAGCDTWPDNGHLDFVSWLSGQTGERYQQMAGQVDRLWVLDVNGQTLVVDATHEPGASQEDVDEQTRIVESLQFDAS